MSILLTVIPYLIVVNQLLTGWILVMAIAEVAVIQLLVQLVFFLHLGNESKPRWKLVVFLSTVSIILIIVIGSMWIMTHLDYNMTPKQMSEYLIQDEGIQK